MEKIHRYEAMVTWKGNRGAGTSAYKSYDRAHHIEVNNKTIIEASSDPAFQGDASKHNPEELFLASLSSCHMLWYLHLCSDNGVIVMQYQDRATGQMVETAAGGHFTEVTLHPQVIISVNSDPAKAVELHDEANKRCFIANSCNFPVGHKASIKINS